VPEEEIQPFPETKGNDFDQKGPLGGTWCFGVLRPDDDFTAKGCAFLKKIAKRVKNSSRYESMNPPSDQELSPQEASWWRSARWSQRSSPTDGKRREKGLYNRSGNKKWVAPRISDQERAS